jgi:hypothetical protein
MPPHAAQPTALQRHGASGAFAVEAGPLGLASSGGRPLPDAVRGKMEAALGADFSGVRVHVGPQAERIGAIAFTVGSDIYFAPGRYQPGTIQGQQLLGHELTHVVQQRAGRVRNPLAAGLAVVQDRALEAEADRMGVRAASLPVQAKLEHPHRHKQLIAPAYTQGVTAIWPRARISTQPHQRWHIVQQQINSRVRWASNENGNNGRFQSVIQRQCANCTNPSCNNGSICKYGGTTYNIGQHGAKKNEQKRLSATYGTPVSGVTHQSEHPFRFAAVNRTSGKSRRQSGQFERDLPAYQEQTGFHRVHPGTGSSTTIGPSGFSSTTYDSAQRDLLEAKNVSAAAQINAGAYSFVPNYQANPQSVASKQSYDSFKAMVGGTDSVSYMQGTTPVDVPLDAWDKIEWEVAAFASRMGRYPNVPEYNEILQRYGEGPVAKTPW